MRPYLSALSLLFSLGLGCGEAGTATDAQPGADDAGIHDGSGSGEGSGGATCWIETGAGFCPVRPEGAAATDCPGALVEDEGFAPGKGLCAASIADWNCPAGWSAVPRFADGSDEPLPAALRAMQICEPPPEPPAECPAGTLAIPGQAGCQPMGIDCPPLGERWHDEATLRTLAPGFTGPILYLSPDGTADGAGTRESPRLLSSAAVRAAQDGILALSVGSHNSAVRLDRHVALIGACVTATTLTTDQPSETLGLVDISPNGAVRVSNLTISGPRPGIWVRGEVEAPHEIEAVTITGTPVYGIILDSPQVTNLRRLRIHDTVARASTRTLGRGLELQNGARAMVEGLAIERVREVGIVLSGAGSTLEAAALTIEETQPRDTDAAFGRGMVVNAGAAATLRDTLVRDNRDVGVSISGAGATLEAERLVVLRTATNARGILGRGLELKAGATATVRDTVLRENHEVALFATDEGSALKATQLFIDRTLPTPTADSYALGAQCQEGARMELDNVAVERSRKIGIELLGNLASLTFDGLTISRTAPSGSLAETGAGLVVRSAASVQGSDLILSQNHGMGLIVADPGSLAEASRVLVFNTVPRSPDDRQGHGIQVENGGHFIGSDLDLRDNSEVAIDLSGTGAQLRADRLLVTATRSRSIDGRAGRALEVSAGADAEVRDAVFRANTELALFASGASTHLVAERLLIADTSPQPRAGILGHGLALQQGVTAALTDLVVAHNHGVGLLVTGEGTSLELRRVAITDTAPHPVDNRFGIGLGLYDQATVRGEEVALLRNTRCALQLAGSAVTLALRRVRLAGSEVGTNLQVEGFGLAELQGALQEEQYDSNGEDVTIAAVEIPDPTTVLNEVPPP